MANYFSKADLSNSESFNNPGNLSDLSTDKYALGKIMNLNVYETPENGIAALCQVLENIQIQGAKTVKEIVYSFIDMQGNLVRTRTVYTSLRKERYIFLMQNNWGINPDEVVDMSNESTRLVFAIVMTELIQGRNIYSYDQFLKGCAISLDLDPSVYEERINASSTLSIESNKQNGFNSPASKTIIDGGSSIGSTFSSEYEQVTPAFTNYKLVGATTEKSKNINSINYSLKNDHVDFVTNSQMETVNGVPKILANMGFDKHLIIDSKVVYINAIGDRARMLDDSTYIINYADGSPDNIIRSSTIELKSNDVEVIASGVISNPVTNASQISKLEKNIDHSAATTSIVTKPLSTAQMVLASYRYR